MRTIPSAPCGRVFAALRRRRSSRASIAAEAAGRYDEALALFQDAEEGWREFGDPYERAHSLLGQGRCLIGLERANEAAQPLNEAHDLFDRLGAAPALAETDSLLQEATELRG